MLLSKTAFAGRSRVFVRFLSLASLCGVATGCGSGEPAFIESSRETLASLAGRDESSGSDDAVDAGAAAEKGAPAMEGGGEPGSNSAGAPEGGVATGGSLGGTLPSVGSGLGEVSIDDGSVVEAPAPRDLSAGGGSGSGGAVDESAFLPSQCRHLGGTGTRVVHVVSKKLSIVSPEQAVLVVHVTGNQGALSLSLGGERAYKGLCLLATGNRASIAVEVDTRVGGIAYVGHGNQSRGSVFVTSRGKVDAGAVSLAGNGAKLEVDTPVASDCSSWKVDKVRGPSSAFSCH